MPIIHVEMLEGRTTDQKRTLASELTDAFIRSCGGDASSVRVVMCDVPAENWAIGGTLVADR